MDSIGFALPPFQEPLRLDREVLDKMLLHAVDQKADDVLLLSGYPVGVIWAERIVRMGVRPLFFEELRELLNSIMQSDNAAIDLMRGQDHDFTYAIQVGRAKTLRFRVNATACLGPTGGAGMEMVFRPMSKIPPTMQELGVPQAIQDACTPKSGMVIVCGPTGSGKTTLLDSIMREQATRPEGQHILTYYSPIENDLQSIPNQTGMIAQMDIGHGYGKHLKTFDLAVRNSLRRHPMVIVYGEARDKETIEGAVLSSMTGHATYTTTHTNNVHMALPRMADLFGDDRVRITNALIDNTRLIVHQRLLKRPDGQGRSPVRSWLVMSQDIRSYLLRVPVDKLGAEMQQMVKECGRDLLTDAQEQFRLGKIHEDALVALTKELSSAT